MCKSRKKNKMRFSQKVLIALAIYILTLTATYSIIYWYKGGYPTEIYLANIPPIIAEIIALCKLEIDKRKYEGDVAESEDKATK